MGYECNKVCPYYEGALDVSRPRTKNGGYMRYVYKVQCCGKSLPFAEYNWRDCCSYSHSSCPQFKIMRICKKYGKVK